MPVATGDPYVLLKMRALGSRQVLAKATCAIERSDVAFRFQLMTPRGTWFGERGPQRRSRWKRRRRSRPPLRARLRTISLGWYPVRERSDCGSPLSDATPKEIGHERHTVLR